MVDKNQLTFAEYPFLVELGLSSYNLGCYKDGAFFANGPEIVSYNPTTNKPIAVIRTGTKEDYQECVKAMEKEKMRWMKTPAPIRGEIIRQIGEAVR